MRIALIADTHLSSRAPECVANWHAARRAVGRLGADLTIHFGDITLDGHRPGDELAFASCLLQQWPTAMRCVPGHRAPGDCAGEVPLDDRLLRACGDIFGPDRWAIRMGNWKLLGVDAQRLGFDSAPDAALWAWIAEQAEPAAEHAHTALFLNRPILGTGSQEATRKRQHLNRTAAERLLKGPLQPTLRLVVSGRAHPQVDATVEGVRHLGVPPTISSPPDDLPTRSGQPLIGIGLLDLGEGSVHFELWCPDGMRRHVVSELAHRRSPFGADATGNASPWV
jgi:alkaline phosphatase D